jgi:hypothetical protein
MRNINNKPKTTILYNYTVKVSQETKDMSASTNERKRQFCIKIRKDNKKLKSSYFSTQQDVNTAERLAIAIIEDIVNEN